MSSQYIFGRQLAFSRNARGWSEDRLAAETNAAARRPLVTEQHIRDWQQSLSVPDEKIVELLAQVLIAESSEPEASKPALIKDFIAAAATDRALMAKGMEMKPTMSRFGRILAGQRAMMGLSEDALAEKVSAAIEQEFSVKSRKTLTGKDIFDLQFGDDLGNTVLPDAYTHLALNNALRWGGRDRERPMRHEGEKFQALDRKGQRLKERLIKFIQSFDEDAQAIIKEHVAYFPETTQEEGEEKEKRFLYRFNKAKEKKLFDSYEQAFEAVGDAYDASKRNQWEEIRKSWDKLYKEYNAFRRTESRGL